MQARTIRTLGVCILAAASFKVSQAHAEWHRAYVIEWFEPAFYYGAKEGDSAPGTDCPAGTNPDMDWRKVLKTSYRTDEEIDKILDPEKPLRGEMGGIRGPNKENVYEKPWSVPDPGMIEVSGKLAYGFNLDGNERNGFRGVDGTKGVDNQYYRIAGCWMAWRGPQRGSHHAKYVMDGMRDGAFTALLVISGKGSDPDNDNDVSVGFYSSKDKMVKDANGGIAADYSFRINPDKRYQSVVKARTVKGVLENAEPAEITMHDVETAPFFPQQLKLFNARLRFTKAADGKMAGLIGGYRNIDEYYRGWAAAGAIHELTTHVNLPAYWYALRRGADAMPDPETKQNMAISTAYSFYLIPAFVTAPNDENEVTVAQVFEGPPPPEPPSRYPAMRSGGGGAATVYPPPPSFRVAREHTSK
ncbi:MAG TPA: hypothetical protein VET48_03315 [Steroidobacteraceae bacterium]|nr:hypothetical protein [Steroidobacteraceae bacterium]